MLHIQGAYGCTGLVHEKIGYHSLYQRDEQFNYHSLYQRDEESESPPTELEDQLYSDRLIIDSVPLLLRLHFQKLFSYLNKNPEHIKEFAEFVRRKESGEFTGLKVICGSQDYLLVAKTEHKIKRKKVVHVSDLLYAELAEKLMKIYQEKAEQAKTKESKMRRRRCKYLFPWEYLMREVYIETITPSGPPKVFKRSPGRKTFSRNRKSHGNKTVSRISIRKASQLSAE